MTTAAVKESPREIPNKLYFRIGEVSELVGVKPYVLRYWESEFAGLAPKKSGTGHRLYRRKDVELALEIKRLLYEKRYTIEGARNFLTARSGSLNPPAAQAVEQGQLFQLPVSVLDGIRKELVEIVKLLK